MRPLDTDTCVAILRGNAAAIERRAATHDNVVATWITVAELHYGAAKSRAPEKNRGLAKSCLATLPIFGLDEASAQIFGEAKAMLEQRGQGLPDADLFIGAIAVANRAIVVTGNRRHYERIPGVMLEDWIRCRHWRRGKQLRLDRRLRRGYPAAPQSSTVFDPVMRQRRHVLVSQPSRAIFEDEQPAR